MSLDRHWPAFLELVREPIATTAMFEFVARLIDDAIGSKLTTATVFDVAGGRLRRVYTEESSCAN